MPKGQSPFKPKQIPWDKPAAGIIPGAPAGLRLWEYAESVDWDRFLEELAAADPRFATTVRNVRAVVRRHAAKRDFGGQHQATEEVNAWASPPRPTGPSDLDLLGVLSGEVEAATEPPPPDPEEFPEYMRDPVVWCRERNIKLDTKDYGLVPFVPYQWQEDIMRKFWQGGRYFVEKSRQEGFSTCLLVAAAHALLYSRKVLGTPLTMPIVADKETTALNLLRIVKVVLTHANLTDEERAALSNVDPESGLKRIRYVTPQGTSWIQIYTSTDSAARSFAFNAALLEEFAWADNAAPIWSSVAPVLRDVPRVRLWVVSTPNGQSFHADLCDDADKLGATYLPMDWRIRPERDQAWRELRTVELGEDLAAQECDLKRIGAGEQLVKAAAVEAHAKRTPWVGPRALPGHVYCKALDLAGPGQDADVFTVVDVTERQFVFQQELSKGLGSEQKLKKVLELHSRWPGKLYIDGTNDSTFPELVSNRARHVVAVRFREAGEKEVEAVDASARLKWRRIPRLNMSGFFKTSLELGDVLLHKEHFPKLWEAVRTAQYARIRQKDDRVEKSQKAKRRGKYPDFWDSAMMACLDVRPRVRRQQRQQGPPPRALRNEGPGQRAREAVAAEHRAPRRPAQGGDWRGRKY